MLRDVESSCKTVKIGESRRQFIAQPPQIPAEDSVWIAKAADVAALCRSLVQRDSYHRLLAFPSPEIGTDLAQSLSRIAQALTLLGVSNYRQHIWRLCWDCIPDVRARILRELIVGADKDNVGPTQEEIAKSTGLSQPSVGHYLEDISLLNIDIQKIAEVGAEVKGLGHNVK